MTNHSLPHSVPQLQVLLHSHCQWTHQYPCLASLAISFYHTVGLCEFYHQRFINLDRHAYQCTVKAALDKMRLCQERSGVEVQSGNSFHQRINLTDVAASLTEDTHSSKPTTVSNQLLGVQYTVGYTAGHHDYVLIFEEILQLHSETATAPNNNCLCLISRIGLCHSGEALVIFAVVSRC